MANEFNRNIQDALVSPAAFALPASASTSTNSTSVDIGKEAHKVEEMEVQLSIPALSTTIAPDTRTVTLLIESSTTSNFAAVDQTIYTGTFTGAGGAGIAAQTVRARVPANCARYLRGKVTFGASTTDGSALNATFSVLF